MKTRNKILFGVLGFYLVSLVLILVMMIFKPGA